MQIDPKISKRFKVLNLSKNRKVPSSIQCLPEVLDLMREMKVRKGKVLFLEDSNQFIREVLLLAFSYCYQCNAYDSYTRIKTRHLYFTLPHNRLGLISKFTLHQKKLQHYLKTYPTYSCMCGASSLILKRHCANLQNIVKKSCNCVNYMNDCPSPGCYEFMNFMQQRGCDKETWSQLDWAIGFNKSDLLLSHKIGQDSQKLVNEHFEDQTARNQLLLNSLTVDKNCVPVSVVE